ncbi:MAG: glycoside hydrolase family 3 protein [Amycolatopsis sp.]|uniref:glycoside hydrolase family 3 N-terminal domain-containing protein n=1 Tax=Amycolatopsis sp. TaxID=37632 RepID=UPI00260B0EB0|nr:glycoside hydrolase family 3 N-terminal domain-containing protein [Amycolatopsis sp.]MCU1684036.1 glycoside hydrolase family 3 protein [Amycolatopsis sp.]
MTEFEPEAHAVLLPVAGGMTVEPWLTQLLERGTQSVLIGETRAEYVGREMTADRRATEKAEDFQAFVADVESRVDGPALLAVDQEPWGITRLHDLVPPFPAGEALAGLPDEEISAAAAAVADAGRRLGVNMFLSPVLDVLTGPNPWLEGRTLPFNENEVGRIGAAFVTGVQSAGVIAVAKHFPGHPDLANDPALGDTVLSAAHSVYAALEPFSRVVAAGVHAVMVGPVVVESVDPKEPASTSAVTIEVLRRRLGFEGLVVSDDLDTPSTTHGRSFVDTVLASLEAGADLLLLPGGPELADIAQQIARRAQREPEFAARLTNAAERVRRVAEIAGSHARRF